MIRAGCSKKWSFVRQLPVAYQPHHITCEMSGFAEMKPMCPEPTYAALYSSVRARRSRRASLLLQGPRLVRRALCFCRVDHGLCPLSSSRCQPPAHHIQSIMPTVYYTTRPRKTANDAKLGLDEMLLLKGSDGFPEGDFEWALKNMLEVWVTPLRMWRKQICNNQVVKGALAEVLQQRFQAECLQLYDLAGSHKDSEQRL
jgi:hypothetical protein